MKIIVFDDLPPEATAMVQALYSRDPRSAEIHLEEVRRRGAEKFMENYYVGYGHKSIGDCGTTTICVENVSMLVAKAVQDTPLYNGQEASTRYLDMATQPLVNPLGTVEGERVQKGWMQLYSRAIELLVPRLKELHPRKPSEKESVWEKAVKAKAFDIARGLIVAGCTTYVAWHTNLRQAHDHTKELELHPLAEVRDAGGAIRGSLKGKYPSSFSHKPVEGQDEYVRASMGRFAYYYEPIKNFAYVNDLDLDGLAKEKGLLASRPPRCELHQRFRRYGQITFRFPLDFGSYRDLQRHRSTIQEMPLLTTRLGFHPWYLENLPAEVVAEIGALTKATEALPVDDLVRQYYTPMGFMVPVVMACPLPAAVYTAELRSGLTVHATLRAEAKRIGDTLEQLVPGLAMHHERGAESWTVKRGAQDIVKK